MNNVFRLERSEKAPAGKVTNLLSPMYSPSRLESPSRPLGKFVRSLLEISNAFRLVKLLKTPACILVGELSELSDRFKNDSLGRPWKTGKLVKELLDRSKWSNLGRFAIAVGQFISELSFKINLFKLVRSEKIFSGRLINEFSFIRNSVRRVRPSKSPAFKAAISDELKSRVPLMLARCASVTSSHRSTASNRATIASRTTSVRSQISAQAIPGNVNNSTRMEVRMYLMIRNEIFVGGVILTSNAISQAPSYG